MPPALHDDYSQDEGVVLQKVYLLRSVFYLASKSPAVSSGSDGWSGDALVGERPQERLSYEQILQLAERYDWDARKAACLAWAESVGGHVYAVGRAGEHGLWQIHPLHRERWPDLWAQSFDPVVNVELAYKIWDSAGRLWWPWTTASLCP